MVKKSKNGSPKKRAIAKKPPVSEVPFWDQLHDMYNHCRRMIGGTAYIGRVLRDEKHLKDVKDIPALTECTSQLLELLNEMQKSLEDIHNSHKDRHGKTKDLQEQLGGIVYGEAYYEWMNNFNEFVLPLSEKFKQAIGGKDVSYE